MNITFTFEDVNPEDAIPIEKLIDHKRYVSAYEGGKSSIREKVLKLAESVDAEMNDIIFAGNDMGIRRRKMYNLIWGTINQLREIGKGE